MSKRREDESRPSASAISQRATVREVPAAKFKDGSVGTVAPRGLRGPSLLPGQGAPERINPEDVELAVLRDAETLDGPKVARAAAGNRTSLAPRSTSPTPVSVEVPRARSIAPAPGERTSTPPTPSARSIQSGTLMSIGSVDPRAPTELSLPTPRPLSVSERAAYLGPPAVVDRASLSLRRSVPGADPNRMGGVTERPRPPSVQPPALTNPRSVPPNPRSVPPNPRSVPPSAAGVPPSSVSIPPRSASIPPRSTGGALNPRSVPPSSASVLPSSASVPPSSASVRPSLRPDSVAPPAQNFARVPRSYSPVSLSPTPTPMKPPRPTPTPMRPPRPTARPPRPELAPSEPPAESSGLGVPPQFQIHSELDAVPHEVQDDAFDLRSVNTLREPLAGRKPQPSADWTPHGPASVGEGERSVRSNRSSSPAVTLLVDPSGDGVPPVSERTPARAAVPLSWVLGGAVFAVVLALIVAFALRPSAPPQAVSPLDGRASAAAPSTAEVAPRDSTPPSAAPGAKRSGAPSAARPSGTAPKSARPAASAASTGSAAPQTSADPNSKGHQSIY